MTYPVLPPEVNSARMFSGVGSAPMLNAAGAWDALASELGSAASSFSSVTSGLTSQAWQGPASAAMAAAAAPYAGWLSAAEAKAAGAAGQARAVAGAFESALAATVHPLQVAANRNGLVQLVETNLLGQNAPAIAAVESEYEQMWAQDVAAMAGYHAGASAAAAQLPQWLLNFRSELQLLGLLFLHPPLKGSTSISTDPDLTIKETGSDYDLGTVSLSNPEDHYVGFQLQSPVFAAGVASGTDPTVADLKIDGYPMPSGQAGETVLYFDSPAAPFLDGQIALPFTDPFA